MGDIGDPSTGTGLAVLAVGGALVALAVVTGLVALLLAARARRAAHHDLAAARAESAELRARLDELERHRPEPAPVLTTEPIGRPEPHDEPVTVTATLPAPVFTDMVVRESVIRLASLTHGVRRALSAEQRHRIRFEVRREVKRSRRQRRTDAKAALREQQRVARAREDAA